MAKQLINLGTSANKGDGDPLRTAFDKINDNFTEVYGLLGADEVDTDDVIAPMLVHNNHTNVTVTRDDDADQIIFTVDQAVTDLQGSVYGDDSTLLVDGVNSIIPKAVVESSTNWDTAFSWGDHAAAGYADGTNEANWDTAFSWGDHAAAGYLVQSDILDGTLTIDVNNTGDLQGSVFGDDSTLLVDSVNSVIPKANVESSADWDTAFSWGDHSVAGYQSATAPFTGDFTGSVFANDSTLLVDGVAGMVVGDIRNNLIETNNITALPGDTDLYIQGGYYSGTPGNPARVNIGTTNTSTIVLGAGDAVIYVNGNASSEVAAGTGIFGAITGDLTGSVFADDSTLLVDGVNGVIPTNVLQGDITNPIRTGNVVIESTTSPGSVTITHAGLGGITLDARTSVDGISLDGRVSLGTVSSSSDFYGEIEFNNGTTLFQSGNDVRFNSPVDFNGTVNFDDATVTGLNIDGDVTGSVFSDDSTLLVDGVNGTIPAANLTGALPAIDGSALTGLPAGYADSDVDTHLNTGSAGSNEVLSWTGSDYAWVAQSGGGSGLQSRSTATGTTSSLADAAEADLDITGFKSYALLTITTDRAARVRLYVSAATRTADASRAEGVDPTSDAGLIAEVITTGADTVIISPGAYGFNLESSPTTTIPCRVTNKSGGASTVQVDLNILQLEA